MLHSTRHPSIRLLLLSTKGADSMDEYRSYIDGNTFGEYNHCDENPGLQRYKFNGKELDLVHGLRLYDYGARMYDDLLGCWTSVDPMAEKYYHISPYVFCVDNPIKFVDDNGERPSAYEAALMASAVYNDKIGKKNQKLLEKANWVQSKIKTSIKKNYTKFFENGLQSEIFERTIDGKTEYAYVYAGTNSVEDGLEDIAQVLGAAPQYYTAIENARILSSELGEKELTFVGHSLGGGEAAAASMATGRAAITFNPASVSIVTKFFANLGNANKVTNYRTVGVTWKNLNFGGDPVNNIQDNLGLKASGLTIPIPIGIGNPLSSHSIETIINYLKHHQ